MIIPASPPKSPPPKSPPPKPEDLPIGTLIVTRHQPRIPVHVLELIPFPGASAGYLVRHDGTGIPALDLADVRPWHGGK